MFGASRTEAEDGLQGRDTIYIGNEKNTFEILRTRPRSTKIVTKRRQYPAQLSTVSQDAQFDPWLAR